MFQTLHFGKVEVGAKQTGIARGTGWELYKSPFPLASWPHCYVIEQLYLDSITLSLFTGHQIIPHCKALPWQLVKTTIILQRSVYIDFKQAHGWMNWNYSTLSAHATKAWLQLSSSSSSSSSSLSFETSLLQTVYIFSLLYVCQVFNWKCWKVELRILASFQ